MKPDRAIALSELLAKPDPEDLPQRSHILTQAGDPDRQLAIKLVQPQIYIQLRRQDVEEARVR